MLSSLFNAGRKTLTNQAVRYFATQTEQTVEKTVEKTSWVPWTIAASSVSFPVAYALFQKQSPQVKAEQPSGTAPGNQEVFKTKIGETLASAIQSFAPINAFKTQMNTILYYPEDKNKQLIVNKYIAHVNEDVMQELIFDSDRSDAKLIGVCYTITEKLFNQLPEEEKKLWSSNAYSVLSGLNVAPRLPYAMEHKLMSDLAPTYGKAIATWQVDKYSLPMGLPTFLAAPSHDGIIRPEVIQDRDRRLGISTVEEAKHRSDIPYPKKISGADELEKTKLRLTTTA